MDAKLTRILLAVIVIGGIALGFYAGIACLRLHSPLFNFFFRPAGLFKPLAESSFEMGRAGAIYSLEFSAQYPGNHAIELVVAKPVVGSSYKASFMLKVSIEDRRGSPFLEKEVSLPTHPFWGGPDNSGLILIYFEVPAEAPLRTPLQAKIVVVKADPAFDENYGPVKLDVRKSSDE
jgi:hypothetical protein